jgi:endonuclease YncB( thermonuclease family)
MADSEYWTAPKTPPLSSLPKYQESMGQNTTGYLQAPGWESNYGNGNAGYLKTPGADTTRGILKTPGDGLGKGFLQTPGGYAWGPTDGYLPTPGSNLIPTRPATPTTDTGKTVEMFTQAYGHQNLGPYLIPRWALAQGDAQQELWQDTAEPTQTWRQSSGISDRELPNSQTPNPEMYKPSSLYDRSVHSRPGGDVYFDPHNRENGGYTNQDTGYLNPQGSFDTRAKANKAPRWISEKAAQGGDWVWGRPVVIDGDSFMLEGHTIRLAGIDAPEEQQLCGKGAIAIACGTEAKSTLAFQIEHQVITCDIHYQDSVGRLISTCYTPDFEINGTLVAKGWAFPWKSAASPYEGMANDAQDGQVGLWALSFQHPEDWRLSQERTKAHAQKNVGNLSGEAAHTEKQFPYIPFGQSPQKRPETILLAPSTLNR